VVCFAACTGVVGARGIRTSDLLLPKQAQDVGGVMDKVDALLDKLRNIVELHNGNTEEMREAVEAAFAALREECAKVAETYLLEAGEGNQITLSGFVGRRIADAIRTAQPARKAQEGA
jgi:uncharacterized membrane-anchored protein YhcB (DUF1043 family)